MDKVTIKHTFKDNPTQVIECELTNLNWRDIEVLKDFEAFMNKHSNHIWEVHVHLSFSKTFPGSFNS